MTDAFEAAVDLEAVARLAADFERGDIDPAGFHHREHMLVALWFLAHEPPAGALARMRAGLHAVLAKIGRDAYHETVTIFWMRVLAHRLMLTSSALPLSSRFEQILAWCAAERSLSRHYSEARLADPAGRREFLAPDLLPMPDEELTVGS